MFLIISQKGVISEIHYNLVISGMKSTKRPVECPVCKDGKKMLPHEVLIIKHAELKKRSFY